MQHGSVHVQTILACATAVWTPLVRLTASQHVPLRMECRRLALHALPALVAFVHHNKHTSRDSSISKLPEGFVRRIRHKVMYSTIGLRPAASDLPGHAFFQVHQFEVQRLP